MSQQTIIQIESSRPPVSSSSSLSTAVGTRAPESALTGATMCIIVIGAIGWLAGIGVLAIPGIAQITTKDPGLAALCGIVVGATIGGAAGGLIGGRIQYPSRLRIPDSYREEWAKLRTCGRKHLRTCGRKESPTMRN